jgi:CheY-like chemotaxis protein
LFLVGTAGSLSSVRNRPKTVKTLLYVDDDPTDRLLVQTACERARVSFLLKTAESGVEAIRYLGGEGPFADRVEHPLPDLIFVDLKMPEMDGFQVLRWIRSHPATRTTPVALYTASLIPEDIAKAHSDGANYFITKPSDLTVLLDIFRAADKYITADPRNDDSLAQFSEPWVI